MAEVMVVTGGSRGIGAAVALLAARRGYDLCINYLRDPVRAEQVATAVRECGCRALTVQANVAIEEQVEAMFKQVDKALGPVRALVNSAGIGGTQGRVDALNRRELETMFGINVYGTFLCAKEAIRRMSTKYGGTGGAIVNLSSAAARLGGAGRNVHYAASKGAINSLTIGLAQEVAAEAIRVNAVSPGVIDTEIQPPGRIAEVGPLLPMQRAGTAAEVAAAILWLVSTDASYVSGTVLDVSGAR